MKPATHKTHPAVWWLFMFMAGVAFHSATGQPQIVKVAHAVEDPRCGLLPAPRL